MPNIQNSVQMKMNLASLKKKKKKKVRMQIVGNMGLRVKNEVLNLLS